MSDSHRHLNPRHGRRHRTDHERKKGTKEDNEAPERKRRKANEFAFKVLETAALRRSILGRPRILRHPSRDRQRLHKHDRRHRHRTDSPSKRRHRSPDESRRGRGDAPNHSWPHGHPPDISKPTSPTSPTSSRFRANSHAAVGSYKDLSDIRVDAHNIQYTGSDHIDTLSDLDDDDHGLSGNVRSDPSDSGDGYDSDVSEAPSCLDTNHKKDIDIAIPSNPDDGRDIDVNKPLSGPEPDNNRDLAINTPSNSEEELTASPRNTPPHSQQLPTPALKFGTVDDADDDYDGLPADASSGPSDSGGTHGGNLNKAPSGLEIDHNEDLGDAPLSDSDEDTTVDSKEDSVDQADTPPPSHETSHRDDDEGSDSESWTSDSSENQEENGCQATPSLSQVATADLADALPKSGKNRAAPLRSGPLHPSEDHQVEVSPNAAIHLQHITDPDSGEISSDSEDTSFDTEDTPSYSEDTSPDSKDTPSNPEDTPSHSEDISSKSEHISSVSEDEDLATGDSDGSTDTSSENEEEVHDGLGQDEGYTHIPPQTSPEKREKTSTFVPVDPVGPVDPAVPVIPSLPQGNGAGSEDSKAEVSPSHSASETESPDPLQSVHLCPGSIVWGRCGHPYVITRIEQDENGKRVFWACLCTSRPQLRKLKRQYGKSKPGKKHFIYLGGNKGNPKGFETADLHLPEESEVKIQGPEMPLQTYLELDEYGPFKPEDFKPSWGEQRHIALSSLEEVLNECKRHGKRKPPKGRRNKPQKGHKKKTNLHGCKKESSWERPRRATGNTHERIFA